MAKAVCRYLLISHRGAPVLARAEQQGKGQPKEDGAGVVRAIGLLAGAVVAAGVRPVPMAANAERGGAPRFEAGAEAEEADQRAGSSEGWSEYPRREHAAAGGGASASGGGCAAGHGSATACRR